MQSSTYEISHIYKNIYISDIYNACDINELKKHKIKAILHLGDNNKCKQILQMYIDNNIDNKFLGMKDTLRSDLSECFEPSWNFIDYHVKHKNNILIHCKKGISRSPSIVAYYLLRKMYNKITNNNIQNINNTQNKDKGKVQVNISDTEYILYDILDLIQINRPCSNPNKHFINQLKKYENNNIHILKIVKSLKSLKI